MVQLNKSNDRDSEATPTYGLGNPNVQYKGTPWDVFWAPVFLLVVSVGMLMYMYDLSVVGFGDWLVDLFNG